MHAAHGPNASSPIEAKAIARPSTLCLVFAIAAAGVCTVSAGEAIATGIEAAPQAQIPVQAGPAAIDISSLDPSFESPLEFDSYNALPIELSSQGRAGTRSADDLRSPADVSGPSFALVRPKLGPLVMEQPVRVYTNDVTVKFKAPGGKSRFATVELVF